MKKTLFLVFWMLFAAANLMAEPEKANSGHPLDEVLAILDKSAPAKHPAAVRVSKRPMRPALVRALRYRSQSAKRAGLGYYDALKTQLQHKTQAVSTSVVQKFEGAKAWGRSQYNALHRALQETENRTQNVIDKLNQLSYIEGKVREYEGKATDITKDLTK